MRRTLGTIALLLALAGCGDETTTAGSPPAGTGEVTLVHATAGGGHVESRATEVSDDADLTAYVAQFSDDLATQVRRAVGAAGGDRVLAQVVAVGCDVPSSATVRDDVIVPEDIANPIQECVAPVTTVAVVSSSAPGT